MENEKYYPNKETEKQDGFEIPTIYRLIEKNADSNNIVNQIQQDFYIASGEDSKEKVFLGIQELLQRGHEGIAALQYLGKSTDSLGSTIRDVLDKNSISTPELEQILDIRRFGRVVNGEDINNDRNVFEEVIRYAQSKGYVPKNATPEDCIHFMQVNKLFGHPHLDETIDDAILATSATFAVDEPVYLELLGPKEILKMRDTDKPNILLLGTFGKYSGREFTDFGRKLNPNTNSVVIDIEHEMLQMVQRDSGSHDKSLLQADARQLPFADNSMDHIYTNYLFRFLENSHDSPARQSILQLFQEANRVLKPGGSLLCCEASYGMYQYHKNSNAAEVEIKSLALQSKFKKISGMAKKYSYALRKEVGSSTISSNGFPHYENAMLETNDVEIELTKKFTKD